MITNFDLRQRMRKVIRPNFQVLLLIALIVALPGLIVSVIISRTGIDLTVYLYNQGFDTTVTVDQLSEAIMGYYQEYGLLLFVLRLIPVLVTPVLMLGFLNAILTLMRGGTAVVGNAFSHLNRVVRATLLSVWVAIRTAIWSLPGFALTVLALFVGTRSDFLGMLLASTGFMLMIALVIMASYRYILANVFLADEPDTGILACVRKSKAVMKGRKLQLFMLELPFNFGRMLVITMGESLLGFGLGTLVSLTVQLVLSVYLSGAVCAFYEAYARPTGGKAHAFQADPYHGEMQD